MKPQATFKLYLAALLLLHAVNANAEQIKLKGINFHCKNCKIISEPNCLEVKNDESFIVKCDDLFDHLLEEKLNSSKGVNQISILSSLQNESFTSDQLRSIFTILLREKTDPALLVNYERTLKKYRRFLENLIIKNKLTKNALENLLYLTVISQKSELKTLLPLIISKIRDEQSSILKTYLLASDIKNDFELLEIFNQSISTHSLKNYNDIIFLYKNLSICIKNDVIAVHRCLASIKDKQNSHYLEKLVFNNSLTLAKNEIFNDESALEILSLANYKSLATNDFYLIANSRLKNYLELHSLSSLSFSIRKMLDFLAIYDKEMRQTLNTHKQTDKGFGLVEIMLASAALLLSCLLYHQRKARKLKHQNLDEKRFLQLQHLLQFFDLPAWASKKDLKKRYREKIKELHPDVNYQASNDHDFRLACENYKLALRIIERR